MSEFLQHGPYLDDVFLTVGSTHNETLFFKPIPEKRQCARGDRKRGEILKLTIIIFVFDVNQRRLPLSDYTAGLRTKNSFHTVRGNRWKLFSALSALLIGHCPLMTEFLLGQWLTRAAHCSRGHTLLQSSQLMWLQYQKHRSSVYINILTVSHLLLQ